MKSYKYFKTVVDNEVKLKPNFQVVDDQKVFCTPGPATKLAWAFFFFQQTNNNRKWKLKNECTFYSNTNHKYSLYKFQYILIEYFKSVFE